MVLWSEDSGGDVEEEVESEHPRREEREREPSIFSNQHSIAVEIYSLYVHIYMYIWSWRRVPMGLA